MHRVVLLLSLLLVGCATCPPKGTPLFSLVDSATTAAAGGPVALAVAGGLMAADLLQYAACP